MSNAPSAAESTACFSPFAGSATGSAGRSGSPGRFASATNEPDRAGRPEGPDVDAARAFTRHLTELLRHEQRAMVEFLLALAECDGRRIWSDLGYASLFDFLHRELGLSRSAAYYRTAAASLVQRYPAVADALADGRICITSLAEIGKVITPENERELLPRFFHRSTREAKELVAEISPATAPTRREIVTVLPSITSPALTSPSVSRLVSAEHSGRMGAGAAAQGSPSADRPTAADTTTGPDATPGGDATTPRDSGQDAVQSIGRTDSRLVAIASGRPHDGASVATAARDDVQPLTSDLRRLHITVTKRWLEKLDAARAALSHSIPSGSAEAVLDAALDALLAQEARRRGMVEKPRRSRLASHRHAHVDVPEQDVEPKQAAAAKQDAEPKREAAPVRNAAVEQEPAPKQHAAPGQERDAAAVDASHPISEQPPDRAPKRRPAIPADVRREVLRRDQGRCQARLHDGTICGSTVRLQFDHIHPVALGGPSTAENLRLLCARHNQLAARAVFGEAWMDSLRTRSP